jgi:hypothetical protein
MAFEGTIVVDGDAKLPEGARVEINVKGPAEPLQTETQFKPALLSLLKLAGIAKDLPEDFAAQHDHYIHGTPKR